MGAVAYALPFFALTLFVSAFLLFLVQPLIGKLILPGLGGTPQVWNTCMVFFQTMLLMGYAYTHMVSTRLKIRTQLLVHGIVLLLPLMLLYIASYVWYADIAAAQDGNWFAYFFWTIKGFKPITGGNPIFAAFYVLLISVGLPFFVVATSAPLLQKWFAYTGHPAAKDPYFLYGASNLGSFLSLIAYPFFLEIVLGLQVQAWVWTLGYTVLVVLIFGCVMMVMSSPRQVTLPRDKEVKEKEPVRETAPVEEKKEEVAVKAGPPPGDKSTSFKKGAKQFKKGQKESRKSLTERREETAAPAPPISVAKTSHDPRLAPVTPLRRLRWIGLAAIPSSLMLGVTTYATTDLSPIPLLWLIPLMLYLLSFVLVFARWPVVWVEKPHDLMVKIQPFTIAALVLALVVGHSATYMVYIISIHILAFFVTTMVCHGELAKDRPATEHLTEFYLLMSVGGMLGGMFNGLLAPILFVYVVEYGVAIFLSGLLRPTMAEVSWLDQFLEGTLGARGGRGKGDRSGATANYPLILDIAGPIVIFIILALMTFLLSGVIQSLMQNLFRLDSARDASMPFLLFVFGVGLFASILFMERPLRYGLTLGGLLLIQALSGHGYTGNLHNDRSYFGVIHVRKVYAGPPNYKRDFGVYYTNMIHGTTDHGMNFRLENEKERFTSKDYSRLATTYYHRKGPAGRVMELFNWFPENPDEGYKANVYRADVRMPATLVAAGLSMNGFSAVPTDQIVALWTEPPYATIGLGTGTMASYARPFQHMHYYEIDKSVLRLSIPTNKGPFYEKGTKEPLFTYLRDAKGRGAEVWVMMGDARLRMKQPYTTKDDFSDWTDAVVQKYYNNLVTVPYIDFAKNDIKDKDMGIMVVDGDVGGGPDNFYHMMVVDAFSSDAIPVHLLTREAIEMYFEKLREDGILCVHTSNKFINLVPVVKSVAESLYYVHKDPNTGEPIMVKDPVTGELVVKKTPYLSYRAHDSSPERDDPKNLDDFGHYTSEWVMVAKKLEYFKRTDIEGKVKEVLKAPQGYVDPRGEPYWDPAKSFGWSPWTDNYSNVVIAIRWPWLR